MAGECVAAGFVTTSFLHDAGVKMIFRGVALNGIKRETAGPG